MSPLMEMKRSLLLFLWSIVSSPFLESVPGSISSGSPTIILTIYAAKDKERKVVALLFPARPRQKFVKWNCACAVVTTPRKWLTEMSESLTSMKDVEVSHLFVEYTENKL